jgi:hypothetical protein
MLRNLRLFAFSFVIATSSLTIVNVQSAKAQFWDFFPKMEDPNNGCTIFGCPVGVEAKSNPSRRSQPAPAKKPQPAKKDDCWFFCENKPTVEINPTIEFDFPVNTNNNSNGAFGNFPVDPSFSNPKGDTTRTGGCLFKNWDGGCN